jgi:hypothetical protein
MTAAMLLMATGCDSEGGDEGAARWRLDYVSASRDMRLHDIAAVSPDEGWALATEERKGDSRSILLHRDGAAWRPAQSPMRLLYDKGAGEEDLDGARLEASGSDNVWLFASAGAVRWDGHRWRRTSVDFTVRDVAVLAADDVWALDASTPDPVAHHWDGKRWTDHHLPTSYYVDSLSASGPDDVWAAGQRDDSPGSAVRFDEKTQPAGVHFDGKKWRPVPMPEYNFPKPKPEEEAWLAEIVALSPDDAWAFGSHSYTTDSGATRHTPVALHWDGSRWQKAPKALDNSGRKFPSGFATVATGDGAGGFVLSNIVGSKQHHTAKGTLRAIKDPAPVAGRSGEITEEDRRQHFELYDLQRVPGTHEIWAVGAVGLPALHGDAAFARGVVASYSTGG